MTQYNLGIAYNSLAEVRDKEKNLTKAIFAYKEALKIRTIEKYPIDYAMTQNNLGNAYRSFAEIRDKEENLTKAIRAYEETLKIYIVEKYPLYYKKVNENIDIALAMKKII
jgi:tetratricopeptide (TPR) repeat protein